MLFILGVASLFISVFVGKFQTASWAQNNSFDICIDDFEDQNQNGLHDTPEPSFPNVEVRLKQAGNDTVIGRLVTSADENCFRGLAAGVYILEYGDGTPLQTTAITTTLTLTNASVTVPLGISACRYDPNAELNQICILVYHDQNNNGVRDGGEAPLPNINVNLQDIGNVSQGQSGLIIRTLVTGTDYSCFTALPTGIYRVYVPFSTNHVLTTGDDSSLSFTGQHAPFCYEFGAQPLDPLNPEATLPDFSGEKDDGLNLDDNTRLLLAILGAVMVVLFMLGVGTILLAIIRR